MMIELFVKRLAGNPCDDHSKYYRVMRYWDSFFADWSIRIHKLYCCTGMDGRKRNH